MRIWIVILTACGSVRLVGRSKLLDEGSRWEDQLLRLSLILLDLEGSSRLGLLLLLSRSSLRRGSINFSDVLALTG